MSDHSTRKQCKKINSEIDAMLKKVQAAAKQRPMAVRKKPATVKPAESPSYYAKLSAYCQRMRQKWGM